MPAARASQPSDFTEFSQADRDLCAQMSAACGDQDLDPATGRPNKPALFLAGGLLKFGGAAGRTLVQQIIAKAPSRLQLVTASAGLRFDGVVTRNSKTVADVATAVAAISVSVGGQLST